MINPQIIRTEVGLTQIEVPIQIDVGGVRPHSGSDDGHSKGIGVE